MKTARFAFQLWWKNKFLIFATALFWLFLAYDMGRLTKFIVPGGITVETDMLYNSMRTCIICLIALCFLSYEYFYMVKRAGLSECLKATKGGLKKLQCSQFLIMVSVVFWTTCIYMGFNVWAYFHLQIGHSAYLLHIICSVLLNVTLLGIVAVLLGWAVSLIFRRLTAYLVLLVFILCTSSIFTGIVSTLYREKGIDLYPLANLFRFYPPDLDYMPNFLMGQPLLPYRVEILLFWAFGLIALICWKLIFRRDKKTFYLRMVATVLCAVNLFLCCMPASKYLLSGDPRESMIESDRVYYERHGNGTAEVTADFTVSAYELDFTIRNVLHAKVAVTVDRELPLYRFTLYHGYKVSKVTDQVGRKLSFDQEGDFITVTPSEATKQLTFTYAGYSARFYSNTQAVCLPGFFAYYPIAGHYSIYDEVKDFTRGIQLRKLAMFQVSVKAPYEITCDLAGQNGKFAGSTNGLTLISGFLETEQWEDIEVVYPYTFSSQFSPDILERELSAMRRVYPDTKKIKKIIVLPSFLAPSAGGATMGNYMLVQSVAGAGDIFYRTSIDPSKEEAANLLLYYRDKKDEFEEIAMEEKNIPNYPDRIKYNLHLYEKIQALGEETVLTKLEEYIKDTEDKRFLYEFLAQL